MDEHTLNDLLECSVCLERLDDSSKVLPCQHTFCRKCLEVIVASRQELRCPECRVLVDVKIDELPPNVLLMRILEGLKNVAAGKQTMEQQQQQQNPQQQQTEEQKREKQVDDKNKLYQLQQQQQQQPNHAIQPQQKPQTALQQQHQHKHKSQQQQQQQNNAQRRCLLPHAYALYDFESSEPTDLRFKKGELILLKHKIDINWYVGQSNGVEGTFPSNYVQVIVPLPTPQCVALYDFKMGPNEEEGCLNFKKGTLIHVLRRVDQNWAEGRIGNMIGIFPIAFVELNELAKKLLNRIETKTSTTISNIARQQQSQSQQQQQQPPQPSVSSFNVQQTRNLPPIPLLDPTMNSSDTTTTTPSSTSHSSITSPSPTNSPVNNNHTNTTPTTTSSSSTSNLSTNSNSLPSTPQHYAHGSGSVRYRNGREKRHSLNALLLNGGNAAPALSILQTNRHSAEILSIPSEELIVGSDAVVENVGANAMPQSTAASEKRQSSTNFQPTTSNTTTTRANVLKTACGHLNIPASLPWGYLALYPYKPRKADELELKKGCVYIVTERCLDGWFKGKNWQDISGVFPGNYVTPLRARDQQQLMHQWKYVPQQQSINPSQAQVLTLNTTMSTQQATNNGGVGAHNQTSSATNNVIFPMHQTPPELPPRTTTTCASVWTKPLSHTVEAFFSRSLSAKSDNTSNDKAKDKEHQKSKDTTTTTSGAVSLMKRLTHIKSRAKSPSNVAKATTNATSANVITSNNQKANGEQGHATISLPHPVHTRSGSCPSQLLQNLPAKNVASQQKQQQQHAPVLNHGSERLKDKERPRIQTARQSMDGTLRNAIYANISPVPTSQPSNSFLLNQKCSQQYQTQQQQPQICGTIQTIETTTTTPHNINHRKSQSLDANNILSNAQCNAVMPKQNSNITTAAIVASATTKSTTYCGRESRFRCILPYPPNSDVELELHVGDIIYVQRPVQKNGWYKGTHARTQKTGLFPASFVEPDL